MWKQQAQPQSSKVSSGYGFSLLLGTLTCTCKEIIIFSTYMHFSTEPIIFITSENTMLSFFCTIQIQKRNMVEPSLDQTEEVYAVEAFQTCHTSTKRGLVTWQERH
jgi:hypothetical protein